jgi:hypothetical protein
VSDITGFNDLGSEAIAANRPVPVVPILEPKVKGYMRSKETTPSPTSGVSAEVKTELDCIKNVTPAPMAMAAYPVRNDHLPGKSVFRAFRSAPAIVPFNTELRILTMPTKEEQRRSSEMKTRMMPVLVSPNPVS